MTLEQAFREIREEWFHAHLAHRPQEREWEEDANQDRREETNRKLKAIYDEQTEGIVRGECFRVCPWCANDLHAPARS